MSFRYMRILVFYDLPTVTSSEIREYTKFRKFLLRNEFMMMQESVYCKLALNASAVDAIISNVKKNKPPDGIVQLLTITEKQYSKIEFIVGESTSELIDSVERLVEL